METAINYIEGQVVEILEKEYNGVTTFRLQFIKKDEKKGYSIISIKVEDEEQIKNIKSGDKVRVPYSISTTNNSSDIFYTMSGDIVKLNNNVKG